MHRGLAVELVLALLLVAVSAAAQDTDNTGSETTLPLEPTVTIDLRKTQQEMEDAAGRERARILATARGSNEPIRSIPEIGLILREVLPAFAASPARFEGAEAGWRVPGSIKPEYLAMRLMALLIKAGFSSVPRCPGEEWSGTHGETRVALRVEERSVGLLLMAPIPDSCTAAGLP